MFRPYQRSSEIVSFWTCLLSSKKKAWQESHSLPWQPCLIFVLDASSCACVYRFFPARLGGLALLIAFIWEISSPPSRDLGYAIARSRLGGLALLSCKRKRILWRIRAEGEILAKRASPPPYKQHLRHFTLCCDLCFFDYTTVLFLPVSWKFIVGLFSMYSFRIVSQAAWLLMKVGVWVTASYSHTSLSTWPEIPIYSSLWFMFKSAQTLLFQEAKTRVSSSLGL